MITFLILTLPSLIIFTIYIVLARRSMMKRRSLLALEGKIDLDLDLESLRRDAVSHSDRDGPAPKRPDSFNVRVSQIIR